MEADNAWAAVHKARDAHRWADCDAPTDEADAWSADEMSEEDEEQ